MVNMKATVVRIAEVLSPDLALRQTADLFFNQLESKKALSLTIDFKGVRSISRSFAQQYLERKKRTTKSIDEVNVPVNVRKMFEVVQEAARRPQLVNLHALKVIPLKGIPAYA